MKLRLPSLLSALVLTLALNAHATVRYVDLTCTNPTPPFLDWSTAATNIQDAIDAAVDGDQILVTNGVYRTGGKVMAGDLLNRVALNKAVTVQSVNGPWATTLLGSGGVTGNSAVRCAWLTDGASLIGFTLQAGATRYLGDYTNLQSGGGVWCASSNALVMNCLILSNTVPWKGAGAFQGTLRNCLLLGNFANYQGAGAYGASLLNCTVLSNLSSGAYFCQLTNCIVYYNPGVNTFSCQMSYCCTTPLPPGTGNFIAPPQVFVDGVHLTDTSPCNGAGTNLVTGTDIFGLPWANPPSIGCAEWQPGPLVTQPQIRLTSSPIGFTAGNVTVGSSTPFSCWWLEDGAPLQDDGHFSGTHTTNLVGSGLSLADAGNYQLVVSNAFGAVTSSVAPLVVHCVAAASANPTPPYSTWATAAATIQDAITAAATNEVILVTNGLYATGGKSMEGILTNRVCVDKAILVASVNGPFVTTIQGAWDPVSTNGTRAVRCAWLTNGAALVGFTVQGGATRASGDGLSLQSGGGVWCASWNALVANCRILSNAAYFSGGGAYQGALRNSLVLGNSARFQGSGAYSARLNNCTVVSNYWGAASSSVYAADSCQVTNCIVYYNASGYNYWGGSLLYCCTTPGAGWTGDFTAAPQLFTDGVHLMGNSPCLGTGTNLALGTDIFGRAWANPPSVGCAEWDPDPLVAQPQIQVASAPTGIAVNAAIAGQPPLACWWLKDGVLLQDDGHFGSTLTTNLVVSGMSYADAGSYQLVVSNAFGMVTSAVARLTVHCVDAASSNPVPPYSTWATAAATIQDAITAALPNEVVLVTNGFYATGGKSMDGVLSNRVAVDKAILVQSVNGAEATIIQGAWDSVSTNGPGAVRCAWLTNNAILSGFTLRGGATQAATANGGGVFGVSTNAFYPNSTVANCIIVSNTASGSGGGAYLVSLTNCTVAANFIRGSGNGGGACNCILRHCTVTQNFAAGHGGGLGATTGAFPSLASNCALTKNSCLAGGAAAVSCILLNCTITGHTGMVDTPPTDLGAAVLSSALTNCVVWGNVQRTGKTYNYSGCTLAYCCTTPLASGSGNMALDPQLLADGVHLAATSPCLGAGTSGLVTGVDIDGQPWNTPPAIGCDEWQPALLFAGQPTWQANAPLGLLGLSVSVAGQSPAYWWSKDGVPLQDDGHYSSSTTANPCVNHFGLGDAGAYQVVVSNAFGMITSQVAQIVIHAVDATSANPAPPYTSWATAASTIQDAINASVPGDVVLVTNGIYASGGKVMAGDLSNRVALDKALTVMSVNGPFATVIQGTWDPVSTNGPGAVRCAWLTNGAVLNGFTLRNGATRADDHSLGSAPTSGGGAWCSSTNALVSNCVLTNNAAAYGGGICYGTLNNSLAVGNVATVFGGAAYAAVLNNCTVENNAAALYAGAGTCSCTVRNSIVAGNFDAYPVDYIMDNYADGPGGPSTKYVYSYTYPAIAGTGNLSSPGASTQFLDIWHIASGSSCAGSGSGLYATGADLEGEPWANPPSMGCDEVVLANLVGPLSVNLVASQTNMLASLTNSLMPRMDYFWGTIAGRAARVEWNYGDGRTVTNAGASTMRAWTNPGDYTVTFTAFNLDNPGGVSTNLLVHVTAPRPPQLQALTLASNRFAFQFNGELLANYTVQYATNLVPPISWQTLQSWTYSSDRVYTITDAAATNGTRFYRVLAQ